MPLVSIMTCLVCFCPIEEKEYTCGNPSCTAVMCGDCTNMYIEHSTQTPRCINKDCNEYILYHTIQDLPTGKHYEKLCFKEMNQNKEKDVKSKLQQETLIEKMRLDKIKFIKEQFPETIYFVSQIALESKLKRLEKQRIEFVKKEIKNTFRNCMNTFCNGTLNKNFTCTRCTTTFCRECEEVLEENHTCNPDTMANVSFLHDMVHCPNCKIPIERSDGCNGMTCASCQTTFDYSNGQLSNHGSSNAPIKLRERTKLTRIHEIRPMWRTYICKIESLEPQNLFNTEKFNNLFKAFYKDQISKEKVCYKLAKYIQDYTVSKYKIKRYFKYLSEVEKKLKDGDLSHRYLSNVIQELSK